MIRCDQPEPGGGQDSLLPPVESPRAEPGLLARVRRGDQWAARELVASVRVIVTRIARAHGMRRVSEDDMIQEIYIKIFARLEQYRGDAPFEHWVSRIAVNTCMDRVRFECRRPELRWADLTENEVEALENLRSDPNAAQPGRHLATNELLDVLLRGLNPVDARLVTWFELEGRTLAEIQEATGWNLNLVKARLFRARRKLQQYYAALPGHDGPSRSRQPLIWRRGHHTPRERPRKQNVEHRPARGVPTAKAA